MTQGSAQCPTCLEQEEFIDMTKPEWQADHAWEGIPEIQVRVGLSNWPCILYIFFYENSNSIL